VTIFTVFEIRPVLH